MTDPGNKHPAKTTTSPCDLPRTIRRVELRAIVPLADTTIYEMEQRGDFPRRFALSPRCVVWDLAEVEAWLVKRRQERQAPTSADLNPDVRLRRTRPVRA
jgi:prophage regulatory protein